MTLAVLSSVTKLRRTLTHATLLGSLLAASACLGGRNRAPSRPAAARAAVDSIARPTDVDAAAMQKRVADSVASASVDSTRRADASDSTGKKPTDSTAAKPVVPPKVAKKAPTTKQCVLDFSESPPETRLRYQRLPDSTGLTFIGGGFVGHCQGENNRIRADSAEQYQSSGTLNLFGNVVYEEPDKLRFQAQHATYFTKEERIFADGNVVATQLKSGSTFRGSSIEYLRPLAGVRIASRLIAPNRPTVSIIERDSTGAPGSPITLTANTMVDEADSILFAFGEVQINRTTLQGEADSASFDKVAERSRLIRTARIINRDPQEPFRLFGDTIDVFSKDQALEKVVALHRGNASNNDVVMLAERIELRFNEQKLDRAYASGKGRAKATTSSQTLVADSIFVRMPLQRVRSVRAIGAAVATGNPDTLKIKSEDRDVLRGDTVTAWFDSTLAPEDTTQRARITEIHARGSASSLFQIASKQGPTAPPGLNYVRGRSIFVAFDSGQVRDVTVDSAASGLYLEPDSTSLSDSTKTRTPVRRPPPALPQQQTPNDPYHGSSIVMVTPRRRL
jgi:lipopolysaccharide export system protein LptA